MSFDLSKWNEVWIYTPFTVFYACTAELSTLAFRTST
jgi:hypothetical protein